jgi:hypothetical protein
LSHLLAARLFGHRIVAWKLFDPDPSTGTLGFVWHVHRRRTLWQLAGHVFIGIAPLVGGGLALLLLLHWMAPALPVPSALGVQATTAYFSSLSWFDTLSFATWAPAESLWLWVNNIWMTRTAWLPLQLYLCIAITTHIAPSPRDLQSRFHGVVAVLLLGAGFAFFAAIMGRSIHAAVVVAAIIAPLVTLVVVFQGLFTVGVAVLGARGSHHRMG